MPLSFRFVTPSPLYACNSPSVDPGRRLCGRPGHSREVRRGGGHADDYGQGHRHDEAGPDREPGHGGEVGNDAVRGEDGGGCGPEHDRSVRRGFLLGVPGGGPRGGAVEERRGRTTHLGVVGGRDVQGGRGPGGQHAGSRDGDHAVPEGRREGVPGRGQAGGPDQEVLGVHHVPDLPVQEPHGDGGGAGGGGGRRGRVRGRGPGGGGFRGGEGGRGGGEREAEDAYGGEDGVGLGADEPAEGDLVPRQERDHGRGVHELLQDAGAEQRAGAADVDALQGGGRDRLQVHSVPAEEGGCGPVRGLLPQEDAEPAPVRAQGADRGLVRRPAAALPVVRGGRGGLGRPAAERVARAAVAGQGAEGDGQEDRAQGDRDDQEAGGGGRGEGGC